MRNYLITGTSSGIGKDAALSLVKKGHRVFAGIRSKDDDDKLSALSLRSLVPLIIDVTDANSLVSALKSIVTSLNGQDLHGIVNNAGVVISAPLELIKIEDFEDQLNVNVTGQLRTIQTFLPLLRKSKGRIVNIGSVSGTVAVPFAGPYCVSKFALRALNNSLRLEVAPWNISVSLIEPGPIKTPIWEKSKLSFMKRREGFDPAGLSLYAKALEIFASMVEKTSKKAVSVEKVTGAIVHALTSPHPKIRYQIGHDAKFQHYFEKFFTDRMLDRTIKKSIGL